MTKSLRRVVFVLGLIALGCSSETAVLGGEPDTPDVAVDAPIDCANYVIQEGSAPINCDEIDKCDPLQINQRVICSFCDPRYNNVAPGECGPEPDAVINPGPDPVGQESCMSCHNNAGDGEPMYSGGGISNPHPFPGADNITCTGCHGGRGDAGGKDFAHVPPPPEIMGPNFGNNDNHLIQDQVAYFNRLTLSGIDKMTALIATLNDPAKPLRPTITLPLLTRAICAL